MFIKSDFLLKKAIRYRKNEDLTNDLMLNLPVVRDRKGWSPCPARDIGSSPRPLQRAGLSPQPEPVFIAGAALFSDFFAR